MNPKHVISEFSRAEKALRAAQLLLSNGLLEDTVSRSYYAIMHAARASLLANDVIAESHAGVRRLFGDVLVRPGLVEKRWASILATEQDQRIVADYDAEALWEKETTEVIVMDARAFVQRIRDYLTGIGINPEG